MKHSQNLQILRGVAALLVFGLHSMLIEQKYGRGVQLIGHIGWVGSVAVDLFFALSGFIMIRITTGRFQSRPYAARFWVERFFRVYPAYWVVSLPVLFIYLFNPGLVNATQGGNVNVLASFLLLPQAILPLLSVGWTLVHEIYFYLVFTLAVAFLPERWRGHLLVAWAFGVVTVGMGVRTDTSPAWLVLVVDPLTLDFIAGGLAALTVPRLASQGARLGVALMWLGVISFAFLLWILPFTIDAIFLHRGWRVLVCAVPCSLLILGAVLSDQSRSNRSWLKRSLSSIGNLSYSFYLVHLLILSLAGKLWLAWGAASKPSAAMVYLAALMVSLAVAHCGQRYIEQPTLRLGRRWAAALERWMGPAGGSPRRDSPQTMPLNEPTP